MSHSRDRIVINSTYVILWICHLISGILVGGSIKQRSAWKIRWANKTALSVSANPDYILRLKLWSITAMPSHRRCKIVFTKESENNAVAAAPRTGVKPILTALLFFFHHTFCRSTAVELVWSSFQFCCSPIVTVNRQKKRSSCYRGCVYRISEYEWALLIFKETSLDS